MSKELKLQPIILCGGYGTRLWPLSRESFPKQFICLNSSSDFSFLQKTQQRLKGFSEIENPIIICNEQHRFIVAEQMRELNIKPKSIILEPCGRNTAPAIAIGALKASQIDSDSILLVLSSDHEMKNPKNFVKAVELGIDEAKKDKLLTFGVRPDEPQTGYGYIEISKKIFESSIKSFPIKKFIEKPNLDKAKEFLNSGNFLWNSGIFLFKTSLILKELNLNEPQLLDFCRESLSKSVTDLDFQRLEISSFSKAPNLSIDVAVMEKTDNANVIPLYAGWSDVGNWRAIWNIGNKDKNGNIIIGDVVAEDVESCYLNSKNKLLVCLGINNLTIVQTDDATLIANTDKAENIKNIVNKMKSDKRIESKIHRKVYRPWGYFNLIEEGNNWKVKEILVNPKSSISLQKHTKRSEHWIILKGKAIVEINGIKNFLKENQSSYIPIGVKHRLSNDENIPLRIIEVQSGEYLGEDDIIRYDDEYGRLDLK